MTLTPNWQTPASRAKQVHRLQNQGSKPQRPVSPDALLPSLLGTLSAMSVELRGWSQALSGRLEDATATFDEAAAEQKALGYREPPAYIRPARESQGDAFRQIRDVFSRRRCLSSRTETAPELWFRALWHCAVRREANDPGARPPGLQRLSTRMEARRFGPAGGETRESVPCSPRNVGFRFSAGIAAPGFVLPRLGRNRIASRA